jgi:uncharacterized membrane protein
MRMRLFAICAVAVMALLVTASSASAQLRVCNQSRKAVFVAVAYANQCNLIGAHGWTKINPRACQAVVNGRLTQQYYYVYAEQAGGGRYWPGTSPYRFCTSRNSFAFYEHDHCSQRGREQKSFTRLNTGRHTSFTYTLTSPNVPLRTYRRTIHFRYDGVASCGQAKRAREESRAACVNQAKAYQRQNYAVDLNTVRTTVTHHDAQHWMTGPPWDRKRHCRGWGNAVCTFQYR